MSDTNGVFIRSVHWPNSYLSLDGTGLTSFSQTGGGKVNMAEVGQSWEYFVIEDLGNGTSAIRSTNFPQVYLRMWAGGAQSDDHVDCQYTHGDCEAFKITPANVGGLQGVSIESVRFPGNFVSFNGDQNSRFVGVSQQVNSWEVLEIVPAPTDPSKQSLDTAISQFGPTLFLYSAEPYLMCPVEWILNNSTLKTISGYTKVHPQASDLPHDTEKDDAWLEIDPGCIMGDMDNAKAYVRAWKPEKSTFIDLQFNFCYAYNGPGYLKVPGLDPFTTDPLGIHWGDWEMCMVRLDITRDAWSIVGAWMSQHSKGKYFSCFDLGQISTMPNSTRPIVYASMNGHAVYPGVGNNPTSILGGALDLYNVTNEGGRSLDCSTTYQIISASWGLGNDFQTPAWVDYKGRWGPAQLKFKNEGALTTALSKIPLFPAGTIIDAIASVLGENPNGPEGPVSKDMWNGDY